MTLPKVQYPTYFMTIPSTGKEVKYRPYTVKEEKILLTALEGGDFKEITQAIKRVVCACVEEDLDIDNLLLVDLEYMFLQVRIKSVGETIDITFTPSKCKEDCKKSYNVMIDLNEASVDDIDFSEFKGTGKTIQLDTNFGITVKYPTTTALDNITEDMTDIDYLNEMMYNTIQTIYTDEEVFPKSEYTKEQIIDFVDSLLNTQLEKLESFYENAPALKLEKEFKCKHCGNDEPIKFEGLYSFFV